MRLIVARCEVRYSGRATAVLPAALRLLMLKSDGSVLVHSDAGGYRPENWMTPPTIVEESPETIVVRRPGGDARARAERLDIRLDEILSDSRHDMGEAAAVQIDGVERDLQLALAQSPAACGEGLELVRREWPTDIGPVDLMLRDSDGLVAVEVKRIATIQAVEQLCRYLERLRHDPVTAGCRGIIAAATVKPQARVLAATRGIGCVEVDLDLLRGEREPELTLFA